VNKDGGAHVDAQVPEAYKFLTEGMGHSQVNGQGNNLPIENAHYAALRHMAFEVLESEELLSLVGSD
jgi:hypothetical protein